MHELSIAMSIVESVAQEVQRQKLPRVVAVHVRIGPLAGVVREALESAFEIAVVDSELSGARLVIEESQLTGRCPRCVDTVPIVSMQEVRCARCGSPIAELVTGRELDVSAVEVADEPAHSPG